MGGDRGIQPGEHAIGVGGHEFGVDEQEVADVKRPAVGLVEVVWAWHQEFGEQIATRRVGQAAQAAVGADVVVEVRRRAAAVAEINRGDAGPVEIVTEVEHHGVLAAFGDVLADVGVAQHHVRRVEQLRHGGRARFAECDAPGQRAAAQVVAEGRAVVVGATRVERHVRIDEVQRGVETRRGRIGLRG